VGEVAGTPAFHTTHWSVVARACDDGNLELQRVALSALCETYWYPVYAFARRKGYAVEDACDLVQSFFTRLLEREDLAQADAERGRFRSFLLGCFVHFLANEWDRANADKRGGGRVEFSLDHERAEGRFQDEPTGEEDPERAFLRNWALTLIERVVVKLRGEYEDGGKGELFEQLRTSLTGDPGGARYAEIAEEMDTTEGAVKVAAHRLRGRFGTLLRREIADTLRDPGDVEDEIRGLFEALG
jgi:RNA polymerase sigma-70 factor (ECF subfamily)